MSSSDRERTTGSRHEPPDYFHGWRRPGPIPPGGIEPEPGETLDYISGHFRIFQYARGHRYSTDDVLTAWYGTLCSPRAERVADLGSGIGSVAIIAAWRLPSATFVTVEAQDISFRLAQKSVRYNGLQTRFTQRHGDLRDPAMFAGEDPFDLVLGSPPYFPPGTATAAEHPQAIPARIEVRGTVADYAATAARILAPGGVFSFVFPALESERAVAGLRAHGLALLRRRDVIFKEGSDPLVSLFTAMREHDLPMVLRDTPWIEPPLTIRCADGTVDEEYARIRMNFGFPPGIVRASCTADARRIVHMPKAWSNKDERQYEHIKESASKKGRSSKRAKAIAAATVNKQRAEEGRTKSKSAKKSSSKKRSSSKKSSGGSKKRSSSKTSSKRK